MRRTSTIESIIEPGLSEKDFNERYGSEAECVKVVARWRWPQGFVCPKCAETKHCLLKHRVLAQCYGCRRQTSITANTVFASTKLPLRTWFKALYLLSVATGPYPTAKLARELGIPYGSAWRLRRKINGGR